MCKCNRVYTLSISVDLNIFSPSLSWKRLYPSCSFWKTFHDRLKGCMGVTSTVNSPEGVHLRLLDFFNKLKIECGEIDGVVLGAWANVNENSSDTVLDQDDVHAGYWAAAAAWSKVWDQRTIDRVSNFSSLPCGIFLLKIL